MSACVAVGIIAVFSSYFMMPDNVLDKLLWAELCPLILIIQCCLVARNKIGELPGKDLKDYFYRRLFFDGLSSLSSITYLASESLKCIYSNLYKSAWRQYSVTYVFQLSISFMLFLFLIARLIFIPFSIEVSYEQVALLKGLISKMKIQILALLVTGVCNLILFVLMVEGTRTDTTLTLFHSAGVCMILIVIS